MNDTITVSKQELSRLENEVKSMKHLLLGLIERIDAVVNAEEKSKRTMLRAFLEKAHAQMPDVSEEEVLHDIEEAIRDARTGE